MAHNYTEKQIDWIMEWYANNFTISEIRNKFNGKFHILLTNNAVSNTINRYKNDYDLSAMDKDKKHKEAKLKLIEDTCLFIKKNSRMPTKHEFTKIKNGFSIQDWYGGIVKFEQLLRKEHPEAFEHILDETLFTSKEFKELKKTAKSTNIFIITTAVTGCDIHKGFYKAIRTYCDDRNAELMILPCSDPARMSDTNKKWRLDDCLRDENIVFKDLKLNDNLFLSTIKLQAKQLLPLTGLSRIAQREGSMILASPKQFLEHVTQGNNKQMTHALMTTGAITEPQYRTERYMSERLGYIATHDHCLGAIIVEVKDNKVFHFRQIQAEPKTGAFCDINKKYHASGKIDEVKPVLLRLPDYHVTETDPVAKGVFKEICNLTSPKYLSVEDFFNGTSISYHDRGKSITKAKKASQGLLSLSDEIIACAEEMEELLSWDTEGIVYIYGNHDHFLYQYLEFCRFVDEAENFHLALKLADKVMDGWNAIQWAFEKYIGIDNADKIIWLKLTDSFKPSGRIENGVHGHLGLNGSRSPGLPALEKAYGPCNAGHSHSPGIWRDVFRVGTCSYLDADKIGYLEGASTWMQTCLLEFPNGSRQLINNIFGEWTISKDYFEKYYFEK